MHTGGEPVRIVREGYPPIPGDTILAKRRYAREHLDHLRKLLMFEPRGHYDMYGALLVEPSLPGRRSCRALHAQRGLQHHVRARDDRLGALRRGPRTGAQDGAGDGGGDRVPMRSGARCYVDAAGRKRELRQRAGFPPGGAAEGGWFLASATWWRTSAYGGAFYAIADAAQFGLDVRKEPYPRPGGCGHGPFQGRQRLHEHRTSSWRRTWASSTEASSPMAASVQRKALRPTSASSPMRRWIAVRRVRASPPGWRPGSSAGSCRRPRSASSRV